MPTETLDKKAERVLLAGVHQGKPDRLSDTTDESMAELSELVKTAGGEVVCEVVQNKSDLESGTYMGEGKLLEIAEMIKTLEIDTVVFDDELSGIQTRNIADILGVKVIDRSMLILDIFAMRAKSGEGKLQVELAQLKYRLARLRGLGEVMSRVGAGIGTRGPGETKLESDRRHIRRRIQALEEELSEIQKHRDLLRKRRKKDGVITAALVGYTNAGKSTLLNAMTDANVFAEDKLFATLDPTSRAIELPDSREILLVDTVGFIRKLPHHLVEAFKSTLEEAAVADVLLHVIDASSEQYSDHISVVKSVLGDLGAGDKPIIAVFNKCDSIAPDTVLVAPSHDSSVMISAKTHEGFDNLIKELSDKAPGKKQEVTAVIPYTEGSVLSELHKTQKILSEDYLDSGTKVTLLCDETAYARIKDYILGGD
ncbi:MAG: GTPase HflX [Clostridia bacterium]|nr:GTPase HflX [Clostridia bacterium]